MFIAENRLWILLSISFIMLLWEGMQPARPWKQKRLNRFAYHGAVTLVNTLMVRLLFLIPMVQWIVWVKSHHGGLANSMGLSGWKEILLTVLVFDFLNYWWHRWNHALPLLWRFHRYHHWDTEMDVTTAWRFQPGELFISYGVKAVWILIWGPSVAAFLWFETLITAFAVFHHANLRLSQVTEKLLQWFLMTPRIHAGHHTVSRRTRDNNYSTILMIWDRIFGTFVRPQDRELEELGTPVGRQQAMSFHAYWASPIKELK